MVQVPAQSITLEAFLRLPETKPASEYIDGRIIQKPMPQGEHSAIQTELATAVNAVLRKNRIARGFSELRCIFGGRSIVPNIAVFSWERIPRTEVGRVANVFSAAPDWTIEILSPDQNQTRVTTNILHCLQHGCQMGWLIDPDEQLVFVYLPNHATTFYNQPDVRLPVPAFADGFSLTIAELFGWLLE